MQVGGGVRSSDQAQFFLDNGATWLLVGTLLYKSPMVVDQLLARFHQHLTAAIDAKGGEIRPSGWVERTCLSVAEVASHVRKLGFRRALFVDIPGDGETGPDFATAKVIAENARIPLFMWGSFRDVEDLDVASRIPGLQGVQVDSGFFLELPQPMMSTSLGCNQEDKV
jgi:phosphoribosylformimino-5-aminoimidazole carboxamide ribonucleotide (ProFAR) isomerase